MLVGKRENTKGFYISLIINFNLNEVEKVIVLAHELGHALLHYHRSTCFIREYMCKIQIASYFRFIGKGIYLWNKIKRQIKKVMII
ncbi:ImmA/IrrE family metallo-endopeptidase [Clostridium coskatii]|uniref:ImmA/IrrE family metallo-endopeptidase n=1 Tax=Clostridium coskatii TaxID=1705578 RepID=UPI00129024C3|nr:ImmA/IrrE family metallo-endopeptidase [Clostridium coskatii]